MQSCKEKSLPLEEVDVVNLQINRFFLTSSTNAALSKFFFSIDHANGTIVNKKPLPYEMELDSVLLKVVTDPSAKRMEVAIDDGEYQKWQSTDSLWLRGCHSLRLMVYSENDASHKNYTVTLNKYDYKPSFFEWKVADGAILPDLNASYVDVLTYGEQVYMVAAIGNTTALYSSDRKDPSLWTLIPTEGLSGTCKQMSIAEDGRAWILTDSGILYQSDDFVHWQEVPSGAGVIALLGAMVYPPGSHTLSFLAEKDGHLYFAKSVDGVFSWQEEASEEFPVKNFTAQLYQKNNHPMLRLVGGVTRAGMPADSVWISSNGNDWIGLKLDSAAIPASLDKGALALTPADGFLYYYATEYSEGVKRLEVSYSKDGGVTWIRGESKLMFPLEPLYENGYPFPYVCAFGDGGYNIYQFSGVSSSGTFFSKLWKGILKLNENN